MAYRSLNSPWAIRGCSSIIFKPKYYSISVFEEGDRVEIASFSFTKSTFKSVFGKTNKIYSDRSAPNYYSFTIFKEGDRVEIVLFSFTKSNLKQHFWTK